MADGNVISISGDPIQSLTANEICVRTLEEWLERARSGEIVGVAMVARHHDLSASYAVAGVIGGYSMMGALEVAKSVLLKVEQDE